MNKTFQLAAVAAVCAAAATSAFADMDVDFHGYFRTGAGGTTSGGNQRCAADATTMIGHLAGRLGNECDSYAEPSLGLGFGDKNGTWGKYHATFAYTPNQAGGTWDSVNYDPNSKTSQMGFANRENWFEMGGVFPSGAFESATVWAGKRFYNRHDIHITDNYYWTNSGVGAGVEGIKLGSAKSAFAYFQNNSDVGQGGDGIPLKRYSFRLYDVPTNQDGKFETELVALRGSSTDGSPTGSGTAMLLSHTQSNVLGGYNKIALVLGNGAGAGSSANNSPLEFNNTGGTSTNGKHRWELHEQFMFDLKGTNWSGMVEASTGTITGTSQGDLKEWNVVARPQYNFSQNFSVAVEAGHGHIDNAGTATTLNKFTIAPQLTLAGGFWARPVLRAFVQRANGTSTHLTSFGVQAEAWW